MILQHIKEFLITFLVIVVVAVIFLTVNYYSKQEKNEAYMEVYGYELIDGEWVK